MAVQELFPGTQVTIGPVIDDGFYYDFARKEPFTEEDLRKIEKKMLEIVERDEPTHREVWWMVKTSMIMMRWQRKNRPIWPGMTSSWAPTRTRRTGRTIKRRVLEVIIIIAVAAAVAVHRRRRRRRRRQIRIQRAMTTKTVRIK